LCQGGVISLYNFCRRAVCVLAPLEELSAPQIRKIKCAREPSQSPLFLPARRGVGLQPGGSAPAGTCWYIASFQPGGRDSFCKSFAQSSRRATTPLPDLTPDANGKLSQEQMQQLFRVVAEKDIENDKRLRDYTYIERDEEHDLDGKGDVKSVDVKTYEVMELYGEQVQRLIEKDGKPLDAGDTEKEEKKIRDSTARTG